MRRNLLIVLLLLTAAPLFAQRRGGEHVSVYAGGRYSHILDGHGMYQDLVNTYDTGGAGVQVGFHSHPSDSSWWANAFNYPTAAVGFSWNHTGGLSYKDISRLGDFYNLYGRAQFDIVRAGWFSFGPALEVGIAFTPKYFQYVSNPLNKFIGSPVEGYLGGGMEFKFMLHPQWQLSLDVTLIHHSDGMTRVPNWGINEVTAGAGIRYFLSPVPDMKRIKLDKPDFPKGLRWNVYTSVAVHACDTERKAQAKRAENGEITLTDKLNVPPRIRAIVGVEAVYRYSRMFSTGIGVEGMYGANRYRETDLILEGREDPKGYSPFFVSVYLTQEFHYDRLSIHAQFGLYAFKRTGLTEDVGRWFQRIGLRYHIPHCGGLYAGFDMRAHKFDRSYCLEPSLGYTF